MNVSQNNDDVVNASVLGDLAANGQDAAGSSMPSIDLGVDGQSMVDQAPSEGSSLDSSNDSGGELDVTPGSGSAIEDSEENQGDQRPGEQAGDALMGDQDPGLMQEGKRVKVYELRDSSWYDRGTGYCKGVYDDTRDLALLIVEAEEQPEKGGEGEDGVGGSDEPGGFLKEELLLSSRVEKDDIYARQQDTLIVWTEPASQLDIALSFQDAEGCEDIWQFISEVQRHLNNMPTEAEQLAVPSSSSPMSQSPLLAGSVAQLPLGENRTAWEAPTLANIKQQEMWLRMQAKSAVGRERAVEHIISEDYIKQLIVVFEQAEDLESLDDLHALCSLMQTILMFNDNTILEYILQDDVFMGIIGMFEYDPDFPNLKASYRTFFSEIARFRQVVDIKAPNIRQKIHQLFRVQYLRDVVLARLLDDGTFGTLNGFVFFTQVDIITHIQTNDGVLTELLATFKDPASSPKAGQQSSQAEATIAGPDGQQIPLSEHKRDVVLFLNQLMVLGKGVQLPNRLQLYRNLLDRGLLFVCEWAFSRQEAQLLHAGAEILTLAVEHDINMVRMHVLKEEESKRRTLIFSILDLLHTTKNLGLLSQLGDSLRLILDTSAEENGFIPRKEGPVSENFTSYFHENCIATLFKPLTDLPEMKPADSTAKFPREKISLYHLLVELLSYQINNQAQASRTSYFILSTPISRQIVSLLYIKDKPLRHAALRFIKSCLRVPNHFIHRYFTKNHMFLPLLDLLSEESTRDNMLSSSCMEVLDLVRRENLKPIINHLFDQYRPRLEALAGRPFIKPYIAGLVTRYEQNNEPAPAPTQNAQAEAESSNAWKRNADAQEDDYFNTSDNEDDTIGPHQPSPSATATSSSPNASPQSKKRKPSPRESLRRQRPNAASPGKMIRGGAPSPTSPSPSLGLDYDDGSDSDGSAGGQSPLLKPLQSQLDDEKKNSLGTAANGDIKPNDILEEDLGDVALKMRAKRMREEEEEEGFAGLLGGKAAKDVKPATDTSATSPTIEAITSEPPSPTGDIKGKGEKEGVGKKIKLSLGSLRRFGAGGGVSK